MKGQCFELRGFAEIKGFNEYEMFLTLRATRDSTAQLDSSGEDGQSSTDDQQVQTDQAESDAETQAVETTEQTSPAGPAAAAVSNEETQSSDGKPEQTNQAGGETRTRTVDTAEGDQRTVAKSSGEGKQVTDSENSLDKLWGKLNEDFKAKQKSGANADLPWKNKFREILETDTNNSNNWEVENQEWEDCKVGEGQLVEYCGYLHLKNNSNEYKVKVKYQGKRGNGKEWEVVIVQKNGNKVKWYDEGTGGGWKPHSSMQWEKHFNGKNGSSNNGWSNLGGTSITI